MLLYRQLCRGRHDDDIDNDNNNNNNIIIITIDIYLLLFFVFFCERENSAADCAVDRQSEKHTTRPRRYGKNVVFVVMLLLFARFNGQHDPRAEKAGM